MHGDPGGGLVRSDATTVSDYLDSLDEGRRDTISTVRDTILANLPDGYEETMNWGMIVYEVPLAVQPDTYNGQPLMFAGLASQKRHCAVYLTPVYQDPEKVARIEAAYTEMGRKPNMGKSCIRFTRIEHLPLELIGEIVAECDMDSFIAGCER